MSQFNRKQLDETTLKEMYETQQLTHKEIAEKLNVSERSVRRWAKKFGIVGRLYIGKDNPMYRHGKECGRFRAHKIKPREACEHCGATQNLGLHHKDMDHYNNTPDNLQVLCVGCHSTLHKKSYWAAIKKGVEPKRSNGPIGWNRKRRA